MATFNIATTKKQFADIAQLADAKETKKLTQEKS